MTHWAKALSAIVLATALTACPRNGIAATPEETSSFEALRKEFQDGLYEVVDRKSIEFARQYPASEYLLEAWIIQAKSRIQLGRFDDAIALLKEKSAQASQRGDEFAFWQAQALLAKRDWVSAADAFSGLIAGYPSSGLRLQGAYSEAFARFRQGDTVKAIGLLRDEKAAFGQLAPANPTDIWAHRGWLLLSELELSANNVPGSEAALKRLEGQTLPPELAWQSQYLLARAKAAANKWSETLSFVTNLWTSATNTVSPELQAAAALLHGEALERLGQPDAASQLYERALASDFPPVQRRAALERIIAVGLAPARSSETVKWLESFVTRNPKDDLLDLARITLGELRLEQYYAAKKAPSDGAPERQQTLTNLLQQARTQFDQLVTNHASSPLVGRGQLGRGWCMWEEGTNHLAEMLLSFRTATEKLPDSAPRAVARFKWADCQTLAGDSAGARSNYWLVATNYAGIPGLTNTMFSQALFQIVRGSIDLADLPGASTAMQRLLELDPTSDLAQRGQLLVAQALNRWGNTRLARETCEDFIKRFTNSHLLAEVRLFISQTHEHENAIPAAIAALEAWLKTYGAETNLPANLVAQADFDLARLSYRAKPDTNAVVLLANFSTRYPDSTNTPLAQYLIGEYYFSQGDYGKAELHFQDRALVGNTNAALSEISYRARLMAGRAAVARQSYPSARDHFDWIITNGPLHVAASPIPISIVAEAYLFRGDTFTMETTAGETNHLARFGEAINAFAKITEHWPSNEFAPLAYGRIGECHLQLATQDPKRYDLAAEAFRKVIDSPAGISVRCQAEFGLGVVRQKQAQLRPDPDRETLAQQALDHYLRILYGQNRRPDETPDPYWLKRAGLAAAELAESQKKLDVAIGICQRLLTEAPSLRMRLEKRIEDLKSQKGTQ